MTTLILKIQTAWIFIADFTYLFILLFIIYLAKTGKLFKNNK